MFMPTYHVLDIENKCDKTDSQTCTPAEPYLVGQLPQKNHGPGAVNKYCCPQDAFEFDNSKLSMLQLS